MLQDKTWYKSIDCFARDKTSFKFSLKVQLTIFENLEIAFVKFVGVGNVLNIVQKEKR